MQAKVHSKAASSVKTGSETQAEEVECLRVLTGKYWTPLPCMGQGRALFTPCVYGRKVYLFAAQPPWRLLSKHSLEAYHLDTREYSTITSIDVACIGDTLTKTISFVAKGKLVLVSDCKTFMVNLDRTREFTYFDHEYWNVNPSSQLVNYGNGIYWTQGTSFLKLSIGEEWKLLQA